MDQLNVGGSQSQSQGTQARNMREVFDTSTRVSLLDSHEAKLMGSE
jgi:hypothetical protein